MRTAALLSTSTLLVAALAACTPPADGPDASAFVAQLPDERILVSLPDDAARAVGELSESYVTTRQVTRDVNDMIGGVLVLIDHITDFQPTWSEDDSRFLWGPWTDGGLDPNDTALYVELDGNVYGWAIVKRPKTSTSDDDWVPVLAGQATPGATDDTGSGFFVFDFDALAAMDPTHTATGRFASTYTFHEDGAVEAEAGFEDFAEHASEPERVNAGYAYGQDLAGAGWMDLGFLEELDGNPLDETVVIRSRWTAEGAGRADVVVFGGDIEPLVFQATECWNTAFLTVYEESNLEMTMDGDAAQCAFDEPEWPET